MATDNKVAAATAEADTQQQADVRSVTDLKNIESIEEAQIIDQRNGTFTRSFTPRQIHIISLGSNIGSGVLLGTGQALASGGPGNMVIAYLIVCSCVWAVLQTLGEMTIAYPTSGNYIDYAERWVDPAIAFGAGLAEWIAWVAIIALEAIFFDVFLQYWTKGDLPLPASITIFLVLIGLIFVLPNKWFGWFEYVTSIIKIFLFLLIILLSICLIAGAGPTGKVHTGEFWRDTPVFKNGFIGFATCAMLALAGTGDQVFIGIMGGEAQSPRFSMAHAVKLVPYRVTFIYMMAVVFITLLVPSDDKRLLGGGGVAASPFVISVLDAGIPVLPDIMNAAMICSILAIGAESVYLSSRILREMAHKKLIPEYFSTVDAQGRPRWALAITCGLGIFLSYLSLSSGGYELFIWLVNVSSTMFFVNFFIISYTSYRFHLALRAQNDPLFNQIYAWKSFKWPTMPAWLFTVAGLLLACCIAASVKPIGASVTAYSFFRYNVGLLIIIVTTALYKVILRTPWRNPNTADLLTGRRILTISEIETLDDYYKQPKWRRFLSYVQLW